ncbi:hypothetical protein [Erwinia sp. MYb416]|uniref:hypothetical protein n=1 Tax=Erwinia sp. MYb416 TaxID=3108532 RepID=UPI0030A0EDC0
MEMRTVQLKRGDLAVGSIIAEVLVTPKEGVYGTVRNAGAKHLKSVEIKLIDGRLVANIA